MKTQTVLTYGKQALKIMPFAIVIALLITACGESSQQKAMEQENKLLKKENLEHNLNDLKQRAVIIKNNLEESRARLVAENGQLQEIKEPQLHRILSSDEEKKQEVEEQALVVQKLKDAISDLEKKQQNTEQQINNIQNQLANL